MNKYNIGQTVYIISINRIVECSISKIQRCNNDSIIYDIATDSYTYEDIKECDIFLSVEELIENLKLNIKK